MEFCSKQVEKMRLPDFLIIGAAKSGTSTLFTYLSKHPQIYTPPKEQTFLLRHKEPNFFGDDENYAKGIECYASLFNGAKPHQLCCEASTDYAKWPQFPESAARIASTLPKVKLIYIMRHPVERAYSYYVHLHRGKKVQETFEEHLQRTSVCLDGSEYMIQIEQYLKFFPRESFLFLFLEEVSQKTTTTLQKTCVFLGIDHSFYTESKDVINANSSSQVFNHTIDVEIKAPLKKIPGMAFASSLLPPKRRSQIYSILEEMPFAKKIKQQYSPPPMRPETRQMLLEKFRPSNQRLADFLNCDLSHWNT